MTATKVTHTAGPLEFTNGHIWTWLGKDLPDNEIAFLNLKRHDANENGRLIAAAPALAEALRDTLRALETHLRDEAKAKGVELNDLCPCNQIEVAAARAALAEAGLGG